MLGGAAVIGAIGFALAWVTDSVTMQGERTIYTVDCQDGAWDAAGRCSGKLVPGDRYRFRALRSHSEVLFWRPGIAENSGRLTDCRIVDGRNWKCPPGPDAPRSITLEMARGEAVREAGAVTRAFHAVPKWRWLAIRWGLPAGSTADAGARPAE